MLSLGTTVPELEQKPFENGSGAARAALRFKCAQRSRARVLSRSAALPRAGADASPGNYGGVLSGILSPDFTTVCDLWTPHSWRQLSKSSSSVQARAAARERYTAKAIAIHQYWQ